MPVAVQKDQLCFMEVKLGYYLSHVMMPVVTSLNAGAWGTVGMIMCPTDGYTMRKALVLLLV